MLHFKPNLFIPGAAKSGTTTLHNLLNQHPDICMSTVKEPGYWKNEKLKEFKDVEKQNYSDLFDKSNCKIYGESSTAYMYYNSFIKNIKNNYEDLPKFIFILRNPIDRFNSHFWWMKGLGLEKENLDCIIKETLIKEDGTLKIISPTIKSYNYYPKYYYQFGLYSKWLKRFYNSFNKSDIKIITFEQLINNPLETTNSCFEFLGLNKLESISSYTSNETSLLKNPNLYHFINKSNIGKYSYTKIAKYFFPKGIINMIKKRIKMLLDNWEKEKINYPKLSIENRNDLKLVYSNDISKLKQLTNNSYKEWVDFS